MQVRENVDTMILTKDPACTCFQVIPPLTETNAGEAAQVERDRESCSSLAANIGRETPGCRQGVGKILPPGSGEASKTEMVF